MTDDELKAIEGQTGVRWTDTGECDHVSEAWAIDFAEPALRSLTAEVRRLQADNERLRHPLVVASEESLHAHDCDLTSAALAGREGKCTCRLAPLLEIIERKTP